MMLHFIIAVCACILLCSFSYLFFDKIINIPIERLYAAKVVYYSMVFSVVIAVLSVPYDAVINSHENMLYYSIVGIIDSFGKLTIAVYITTFVSGDKLIVYGILMAALSIAVMMAMQIYCHKHYPECVFKPVTYFRRKDETDGIFCIMETIHTVYKYGRKLWCGFINEPLFWSSH